MSAPTSGFVTRQGGQLYLGTSRFRFSGTNEYWLGRDETEDGRIPTRYRIEDGLHTAAGMALGVVRSHTLGISTGHADAFEPRLGTFNDSALDQTDYAISVAEWLGLRLILPLTNNGCHVAGCRQDYTRWLGLSNTSSFYTDEQAIGAFRTYVKRRLDHVNPYTGRRARDEPAIIAWESGNELTMLEHNDGGPPPAEWTCGLAHFIKGIDANHLFMDGAYGVDPNTLGCAAVDLHSNHYYPADAARLAEDVKACAAARKPLVIGEYGWTDNSSTAPFLAAAEAAESVVAGTAFWSVFPHADGHGFVAHPDGFTFHYPGDDGNMRSFRAATWRHAWAMRGVDAPPSTPTPPLAPRVTAANATHVAWAGAALAARYSVAVKDGSAAGARWRVVCDQCATDNDTPVRVAGGIPVAALVQVTGYGVGGRASPPSKPFKRST